MRISDWSSDVCSSDLAVEQRCVELPLHLGQRHAGGRLGQVQAFGGGTHAAMQRDLHEHVQLARADVDHQSILRSEERREGKECVSTCGSRWSPAYSNKHINSNITYVLLLLIIL